MYDKQRVVKGLGLNRSMQGFQFCWNCGIPTVTRLEFWFLVVWAGKPEGDRAVFLKIWTRVNWNLGYGGWVERWRGRVTGIRKVTELEFCFTQILDLSLPTNYNSILIAFIFQFTLPLNWNVSKFEGSKEVPGLHEYMSSA